MHKASRLVAKVYLMSRLSLSSRTLLALGLLVRLAIICLFSSRALNDLYAPFLAHAVQFPSLNPWSTWLESGGDTQAFPYGFVTYFALLPMQFLFSPLTPIGVEFAYFITLVVFDGFTLLVLIRLFPDRPNQVLKYYWFSPLVLVPTYVFGFNDILPAFFLLSSVMLIRKGHYGWSGLCVGLAVSAKLSMLLAVPILVVFLAGRKFRPALRPFLFGLGATQLITAVPYFLSDGARTMLLTNSEVQGAFQTSLDLGADSRLLALPLALAILLYSVWRLPRMNESILEGAITLVLLSVLLFSPDSPGWFVWVAPFIVSFQMRTSQSGLILTWLLSTLYAVTALSSTSWSTRYFLTDLPAFIATTTDGEAFEFAGQILSTLLAAVGVLTGIKIWNEVVQRSDLVRLTMHPVSIAIAGDSSTGKDTLANSITGLFGPKSVTHISGDDYHLWDRSKPMWKVLTHLNPAANDLDRFRDDIHKLLRRRSILTTRYDHQLGRVGLPTMVKGRDYIIASGLHAFHDPSLRAAYDLKIFLLPEEGLRQGFKIRRDTLKRGRSVEEVRDSIELRRPDFTKFVLPQAHFSDLIFSLRPGVGFGIGAKDLNSSGDYSLEVATRDRSALILVRQALIGIGGLSVTPIEHRTDGFFSLEMSGAISPDGIQHLAERLWPEISDYLSLRPVWRGNLDGVMQLFVLLFLKLSLTHRLVR